MIFTLSKAPAEVEEAAEAVADVPADFGLL